MISLLLDKGKPRMELGTQFLFFFGSLGVFNGLLMSFYFLFFARPKRSQNVYFGLLILMLSIRIGKSVLFYFTTDLPKLVLQIGLSACAFIGPLLYFYLRMLIQLEELKQRTIHLHFGIIGAIVLLIGLSLPYEQYPEWWNPEIVQGIYAIWMAYIVAATYFMRTFLRQAMMQPNSLTEVEQWPLIVWGTNVMIALVYHSILYVGFPSYILGPITFSLVFYVLLIFLLFYPRSSVIIRGEKKRYFNKQIPKEQAERMKAQLERLMAEEHLYRHPQLKLKDLADQLNVSAHLLSQFLNDNLNKSFAEFTNQYRIRAACNLLQENRQLTIEGIAMEVGFRAKSTFYAAFKKEMGLTPNQFLKHHDVNAA